MVALAAVQWGSWPLFLFLAGPVEPALQSTIVMAVVTLASAPLLLFDRLRNREKIGVWHWIGIVWLGVGDAMNVVLFFRAYATTSVAIAVTTHYLAPILVAAAAPFALGERAPLRTWGAVLASFVGLVVMLRPWSGANTNDLIGGALGFGSAAFYASNVLVNKKLNTRFSGSELVFLHGLVATPFLALMVSKWSASPHALFVLTLGGIGPGTIAALLFIASLRRIPASHAMTLALLEPLTAFIVGFAALRQHVAALSIVGGAIILASATVVILHD